MERNSFIVHVTQEDYAHSQAFVSEKFSPLAVALRRVFPNADIKVGRNFVSLNNQVFFVDNDWEDDRLNRMIIAKIQSAKRGIGVPSDEVEIYHNGN